MDFYDVITAPRDETKGHDIDQNMYRQYKSNHGSYHFEYPFYSMQRNKETGLLSKTNRYKIKYTQRGEKGPILLLLHGVPSNRKMYYPLQKRLSPFFRTISIDMLGMGQSSKPLNYGFEINNDMLDYMLNDYDIQQYDEPKPWDWINDIFYIEMLMRDLYGDEKFIFFADDWGTGINGHYAVNFNDRLLGYGVLDGIAFNGYPVPEIQAIGRLSLLDDETFKMAVGGLDQTMVQIFKTMTYDPNKWNQYVLRDIMGTYVDSDYRTLDTSLTMNLKLDAIRVLADRSAILSPGLLEPFDPIKNPKGLQFNRITVPSLILWGKQDNMMPEIQRHLFANVLYNSPCRTQEIENAGHFAGTDKPNKVCDAIIDFVRQMYGPKVLGDGYLGLDGIAKGNEELALEGIRGIFQI